MAKLNPNPVVHLHVTIRRDQMDALVLHTKHGGHLNLSEATRNVLDQVFRHNNMTVTDQYIAATPRPPIQPLERIEEAAS